MFTSRSMVHFSMSPFKILLSLSCVVLWIKKPTNITIHAKTALLFSLYASAFLDCIANGGSRQFSGLTSCDFQYQMAAGAIKKIPQRPSKTWLHIAITHLYAH